MIKVSDKVMIPQDHHPDINFMGLIIGPRGNTLKALEKETGAKVSVLLLLWLVDGIITFIGGYFVLLEKKFKNREIKRGFAGEIGVKTKSTKWPK